ncbi:carbonic anhydrase-related protein 10 [Halyomorpha halys]|uniref:carbonic anhydrase-related protein 10 n=1 Tax=Halyomorpha halys TaxID=286706 RepID=UPI0034D25BBD
MVLPSLFLLLCSLEGLLGLSWEEWWTYDGISGPAFWGRINPEWSLCHKGRRQSPVNLEPAKLLFDPNLRVLHMDRQRVDGILSNTGHSVLFRVDNNTRNHVNFTGGPLSYRYQLDHIDIHFGLHDSIGSEHTINGQSFPAELQIFGFNSQLYSNFSEAIQRAQGIVAISVLLQLGDLSNPELRRLTENMERIKHGGEEIDVKQLLVQGLIPETDYYMTYDGSTTAPPCHETLVWLILNRPIYITKQQLHGMRRLMQGEGNDDKAPLGNNFRPPQPLHHRPIRTNIEFNNKAGTKQCPSMYKEVYYKANNWKLH